MYVYNFLHVLLFALYETKKLVQEMLLVTFYSTLSCKV